jgi:hypothetical protein
MRAVRSWLVRGRSVVLLSVITCVAIACGTNSGPGGEVSVGEPTPAFLASAAQRMESAATGKLDGEYIMELSGAFPFDDGTGSAKLRARMTGEYDLSQNRSQLSLEVVEIAATGSYQDDGDMPIVGDRYEVMLDGSTSYQRETLRGEPKLTDGKPWRRQENRSGEELMFAFGFLDGSAPDPQALLDQLASVSTDVTELEATQVRTIDVRHYRAQVSYQKLMERSSTTTSVGPIRMPDYSNLTYQVDVYVDAAGLVRRIASDVDLGDFFEQMAREFGEFGGTTATPASSAFSYRVMSSVDFFDIGEPVTIDVPADADVSTSKPFTSVGTAVTDDEEPSTRPSPTSTR